MASSYAAVSSLIPYIMEPVLQYAKETMFMPNLVNVKTDMTGMQPRAYRINPSGGTVWNNMSETVDLTAQDFNYTALGTITPKEVGYRIDVYDQRQATDAVFGVDEMADIATEFQYKVMRQVEIDLISNFSAFTMGTVWAGTTTSTAGTLVWGNIYAARAILEKNKIPGPYYCVVDNLHYHYLATAANVAALTSAAPLQIRNDIQTQYLVQQITNDMFLYTSPNIGTSTIAQYQMGVFSRAAMTLDFRRGFRIEPQRDASNRLTELNATMVYGHALIQPTYGVLIKGTVLTTVNN